MGGIRGGRRFSRQILTAVSVVAGVAAIVCLVLLKGTGSDIAGAISAVFAVLAVGLQIKPSKSQPGENKDGVKEARPEAALPAPIRDFRRELGIGPAAWRRNTVVDAVKQRISTGASPLVLYGLPGMGKTMAMCDAADELACGRRVLALSLGGGSAPEPRHLARLLRHGTEEGIVVLIDGMDPDWNAVNTVTLISRLSGALVLVTACTPPPGALAWQTVPVRPLDRGESHDLIAHQINALDLSVDPEQVLRTAPASVSSHPRALCVFLEHVKRTPIGLLTGSDRLPDDVRHALETATEAVSELSPAQRLSLAFAKALGGARLSDVRAAGLALPADFAAALDWLVIRCLAYLSSDSVDVPALVAERLAQEDRECGRSAANAIAGPLRGIIANSNPGVEAALTATLVPIAQEWAREEAWATLRETVSAELLAGLNQRGRWTEYVLLTRLRIDAADHLGDLSDAVGLRCQLARKLAQQGDLDAGWELLRRAQNALSEENPAVLRARVAQHRALLAHLQGDEHYALRELKASILLFASADDAEGVLVARKLEGNILLRKGDYAGAAEAYKVALAMTGTTADLKHRLEAETSLAVCETHLGREAIAEGRLQRVIKQMQESRIDAELPRALFTYALLAEQCDRPADALQLARQAASQPARDPAVRIAVERLIWRLEHFDQRAAIQGAVTDQEKTA
jgi:tetratricopeptide (TPR) repeat protein